MKAARYLSRAWTEHGLMFKVGLVISWLVITAAFVLKLYQWITH